MEGHWLPRDAAQTARLQESSRSWASNGGDSGGCKPILLLRNSNIWENKNKTVPYCEHLNITIIKNSITILYFQFVDHEYQRSLMHKQWIRDRRRARADANALEGFTPTGRRLERIPRRLFADEDCESPIKRRRLEFDDWYIFFVFPHPYPHLPISLSLFNSLSNSIFFIIWIRQEATIVVRWLNSIYYVHYQIIPIRDCSIFPIHFTFFDISLSLPDFLPTRITYFILLPFLPIIIIIIFIFPVWSVIKALNNFAAQRNRVP